MKKLFRTIIVIILLVGVGFVYVVKNPDLPISQKILTTIGITTSQSSVQSTGIDLTNCISYFDGCNNCSVKDGKPDACTLMYCETPSQPKCNEYATGVDTSTGTAGMANPASVNCEKNGGTLDIVTSSDGGQVGMCTLENGTVCEERAYMRGECPVPTPGKACTEEAKVCPDGSAVGRSGPNCEFAPCPDEEPTACTMEYAPVCASVAVQCIKAPCNSIQQTFSNRCMMNANKLATFVHDGECGSVNR